MKRAWAGLLWCAALPSQAEEVIVTARRVAEPLERLPLSVDVVGADRIGPGQVTDLLSLSAEVPGLSFESLWGGAFAAPVLRGQSQPSTAGDNVGLFVDDVYQSGRFTVDVMPLDLERIEVVRGPQNTLYGRSTFSGAIQYVPRAPTEELSGYLRAQLGTGALAGFEGAASSAVFGTNWLARVAAGHREADGTWTSTLGESLDDRRQDAVALTIAHEDRLRLSARYQESSFSHPASTTLDGVDYNCGARDTVSQLWSYYCGHAPVGTRYELSAGLPRSRSSTGQAALRLEQPFGGTALRAFVAYYTSSASTYRDFDNSTTGLPLGVCTQGLNCVPVAPPPSLTRLASPQVVSRLDRDVDEWSAELRWGSAANARVQWALGLSGFVSRAGEAGAFGADRDDLAANERLTSLLAATPLFVGPLSPLNGAIVADSRAEQLVQTDVDWRREGIAAFGVLDLPLDERSRLRFELRGESEKERADLRTAGYRPVEDGALPPSDLDQWLPRVSIDRRLGAHWYGWASIAKGARSGGVNLLAGLSPEEQAYDPEYNWTTEVGWRHEGEGFVSAWEGAIYYIDWRHTQILGVSTTPGVNSLVTSNTAGLATRGFETQLQLAMGSHWSATLAYSYSDPRFVAGSDDAGSRVFCGLAARPPGSDFCAFGPPRMDNNGSTPLVPYIDDRLAARAPQHSAWAALRSNPVGIAGWRVWGQLSLAYQGNVFERPINGVDYGERTLLGAGMTLARGGWRIEAWGTNLTNERYIRTASSRGGAFYPSMPRPIDFLYGEGRRVGVTVGVEIGTR